MVNAPPSTSSGIACRQAQVSVSLNFTIFTFLYWNSMKIIALTDIHGRRGILHSLSAKLKSADMVILCGDITHFGHSNDAALIIEELSSINPNVIAVTGNCDHPDSEQYLVDKGYSVFGKVRNLGGISFFGIGGSLPCPGRTPNEYTEEEYEAILADICFPKDEPVIMVSHQPPFNTLNDAVPVNNHVGSRSIRDFITRVNPLICFTGHIHEGIGIDFIGKSAIVNPGPAFTGGYAFAAIEKKIVTKLEILKIAQRC
jgi:uncharacterized protein